MNGVLINCGLIIAGAFAGRLLRAYINDKITDSLLSILGIFTVVIGVKIALRFENILVMLGCLLVGATIGTALDLEQRVEKWLTSLHLRSTSIFAKKNKKSSDSEASKVILNASILYCTGAMAILGPIDSAMRGDHQILITKGIIDGIYALTLGAVYGPVVGLAAVAVFVYQGAIAIFATQLLYLNDPSNLNNLSGVGGVLLVAIGLSMLKIRAFRVGNFVPAIFVFLFYAWILTLNS